MNYKITPSDCPIDYPFNGIPAGPSLEDTLADTKARILKYNLNLRKEQEERRINKIRQEKMWFLGILLLGIVMVSGIYFMLS